MDNAVVEIRQPKGEILYNISTQPGQSGSPIIDISQNEPSIIGIHKGGKKTIYGMEFNSGRLLT